MLGRVASSLSGASLTRKVEGLGRSRLGLALVALVCGLGIAASSVTLVRAADDAGLLDFLRGQSLHRFIDPIRLRPRYASEPPLVYRPRSEVRRREALRQQRRDARRHEIRQAAPWRPAPRRVADALTPRPELHDPSRPPVARRVRVELAAMSQAGGRRTMCVRTCDGYLFPIGTLHSRGDLDIHQIACNAACPGTETRLYTLSAGQPLEDPSGARSVLDGTVYARLKTAFLFRKKSVEACNCRPHGTIASVLPILLDPTLRRGDVVVDTNGDAKAYAGGSKLPRSPRAFASYEGSRALNRQTKAQVDRLMGTSVRRKVAADYERSERQRLAGLRPVEPTASLAEVRPRGPMRQAAFREVSAPAGSGKSVRAFTFSAQGTRHASGAQIITIQ